MMRVIKEWGIIVNVILEVNIRDCNVIKIGNVCEGILNIEII
jgi:hypothetical protein